MEKPLIFLTSSAASDQVAALLEEYPTLKIVAESQQKIILSGHIQIARAYNDFPCIKDIELEITIPLDQALFPYVKDTGKHIAVDYPHRYASGLLCLATDFDLMLHFINGFDLIQWMKDFVEPYYFSHEYFQRFGVFPFGDREHAFIGIIQSYCDVLGIEKWAETAAVMCKIESNSLYRGHLPCFCGSGMKMRNCHGQHILLFYQHPQLKEQLKADLSIIRKELNELNHGKNSNTSE